jgi:hypothetical protein
MYIDHPQFRLTKLLINKHFIAVFSELFCAFVSQFLFRLHREGMTNMFRLALTMRVIRGKFCQMIEHLRKRFIEQRQLSVIYLFHEVCFTFLLSKMRGFDYVYKKEKKKTI